MGLRSLIINILLFQFGDRLQTSESNLKTVLALGKINESSLILQASGKHMVRSDSRPFRYNNIITHIQF